MNILTCSRHRIGHNFIGIPVLSVLFLYSLACLSQEREHGAATMEIIGVFCPLDHLREIYLQYAKTEIQEGIIREEVLPLWIADNNSSEIESIDKARERYRKWVDFIDNFTYTDVFLKVVENEFTSDELNTLNEYLTTASGKKLVQLFMVVFPRIEAGEEALLHLDPSDQITRDYFAEDLDDFIAFNKTELGRKFLFYNTETDIHIPKIITLCHAVLRNVVSVSIERHNLQRFQNEYIRDTSSVIVAKTSITNGTILSRNLLAIREYPNDEIPAGSLYLNALDLMLNGRVNTDINAGTPVTMAQVDSTLVVVPRDSVPAGSVITRSGFAVREIASANVSPDHLVPDEFAGIEFDILTDAIDAGIPVRKSSIMSQHDSCQSATGLRSIEGTELLDVSFTNSRKNNVRLNWINYDGKEVGYGEINANQTKPMQTYKTHPWVIRSLDGECLALFIFTENTQVNIK